MGELVNHIYWWTQHARCSMGLKQEVHELEILCASTDLSNDLKTVDTFLNLMIFVLLWVTHISVLDFGRHFRIPQPKRIFRPHDSSSEILIVHSVYLLSNNKFPLLASQVRSSQIIQKNSLLVACRVHMTAFHTFCFFRGAEVS